MSSFGNDAPRVAQIYWSVLLDTNGVVGDSRIA